MKRPNISQEAIDIFTYVVDRQDRKGFAKYNETIDDAKDEDYDWNEMLLEELVDAIKYTLKENTRLQKENIQLRNKVDFIENLSKQHD